MTKFLTKKYIVDQTVRKTNIETTIHGQIQTEITTQSITEIAQTQTPEKDIVLTTVLQVLQIKDTETIQTIGTGNIKITDHETIQTKDQTIIIITIDRVTNLRIDFQINKNDKKLFLNHRNIKIQNKTNEVVHLNIKNKLTKYHQLKKHNQRPSRY